MNKKSDKRIWEPDETCSPFFLNTVFNTFSDTQTIFSFFVPSGSVAVISHLLFLDATLFGQTQKRVARIVLVRGEERENAVPSPTPDAIQIYTTGALTRVREYDNVPGVPDLAGWPIGGSTSPPKQVRIPLPGGQTYRFVILTDGTIYGGAECQIGGWTFDDSK